MRMFNAVLFVVLVSSCNPVDVPQAGTKTSAVAKQDASSAKNTDYSSTALTGESKAPVTRHLPGTLITDASGKKVYLVGSDGTSASFASTSLVSASGYSMSSVITVTAAELSCYGVGKEIAAALTPPTSGKLRDGALVKEKGKTDVFVVSDGIAWPVINGIVFTEAGYDFANVKEIAAGSLAGKVEAIGNCVSSIACLDEAYLMTCAKESVDDLSPVLTGTGTSTSTTTTTKKTEATRHLPGTVITTETGKYVYLVKGDGTVSPFLNTEIVIASGYAATMIITVSAEELYCYGRGKNITTALAPSASGKLHEGWLYKEKGKSDTFVISDGIAWPIKNGAVFELAGYDFANVVELEVGVLSRSVSVVGNCVSGKYCLNEEYLRSCAQDDVSTEETPVTVTTATTNTNTSTSTATVPVTSIGVAVSTSSVTSIQTGTVTLVAATTGTQSVVSGVTGTQTGTSVGGTSTGTVVSVSATGSTQSITATNTITAVATGIQVSTSSIADGGVLALDLSWVYSAMGTKLCLNAAYFAGGNRAVLMIWTGPGADLATGSVTVQTSDRFCWDFMNREKGLYYFWADVPDALCNTDICSRDAIPGNGAMYMTAPKATNAARKWLACQQTGCDGAAYWDGSVFTPMGG